MNTTKTTCDLVIAGGELGLIDEDYCNKNSVCIRDDETPVKRLAKGYTSVFHDSNIQYVILEVEFKDY